VTDAMIDTAIIVDLIRNHTPALNWLKTQVNVDLGIATVTWMEVVKGANNKSDLTAVRKLMEQFDVVDLTATDQRWAMANYAAFKLSHGVGMYNALIAAPAQRLGIPLYTHNLKHIQPLLPKLAQKPY
jgi:predicted nucleic acid-binding protein